jgi:gephyrin
MTQSPYAMLSVEDALTIVLANTSRLPATHVGLVDAGGRVLAEDVVAREPLPPFAASVKDGYAVVASDGPGEYPVIGEARAGRISDFSVMPGTVAYITTGAPMPDGADAVVMVEDTEVIDSDDSAVRIVHAVRPGDDVRQVGVDLQPGQPVLSVGTRLGAAELGLLATAGMERVSVFRRPRVAVLSSWDELVSTGDELGPGRIWDSNRIMLMGAIREAGAVPVDLGISGDNKNELTRRIERGIRDTDMLVTSGGVSMGDLDLIKPLLERMGEIRFGRIRMKPGKPLTFATAEVNGEIRLVFGLPGNPVSSLVTFFLFAVPAIRKMGGWSRPGLPRIQTQLAQPVALDTERPEYHRATLKWNRSLNDGRGGYLATSTGSQASSRLLSMRTANALLELPAGDGGLPRGAVVDALLIGDLLERE